MVAVVVEVVVVTVVVVVVGVVVKKESLDFHSFLDPRDLDSGNVRRPLGDESELPSYLSYRVDAYVQSCISVSDLCSRVLRRVARASHAQFGDHLG